MAKRTINITMNMKEKPEQKISPQRRFSTGNSIIKLTEPTPIPNYLRASIGSCHDFCKFGTKHSFRPRSTKPPLSPKPDHNKTVKTALLEEKPSNKNHKGKKILSPSTTKLEQPSKGKNAAPRTFLKGSSDIRTRSNRGKDVIRAPKTIKKTTYLTPTRSFLTGLSIKAQTPKSRTSKSSLLPKRVVVPQMKTIKKHVEKSKTKTPTNYENVPEKIIHVVEQKDEKTPNEDPKVEPSRSRINTRGGRVIIQEENDSSPRKLKFRRGKVLEVRNGNEGSMMDKSLRKVGTEKEFVHKKNDSLKGFLQRQGTERKKTNMGLYNIVIEETASKLVKMRKSKVEALVGAFETVIKIHDYESSRTSSAF